MSGRVKHQGSASSTPVPKTTEDIRADPELRYKSMVLLFDLRNVAKNHDSERRILATTDELYISGPYFTPDETALVKKATVIWNPERGEYGVETIHMSGEPKSVEDVIHLALGNFFEKRKASGDIRPCGPHDIAPLYESIFGISQTELEDDRFQSRLRRQGLPPCTPTGAKKNSTGMDAKGAKEMPKKPGKGRKGR
ncbi:hypothetical protein HD806DRAFT_546059 [Xylariaceae sp. AK1471]|nr:hypothetical protein HD806DRAFT_546059 [Xylariaceae sp. AK1471]